MKPGSYSVPVPKADVSIRVFERFPEPGHQPLRFTVGVFDGQ
jgi:hypothetical protein